MEIEITMDDNTKPMQQELNYYCDINLNPVCRVCLEKSQPNKKIYNIFETMRSGHVSNMIMACASVQIMQDDGLPNIICHKCMAKLNVAWQFKILCENSDVKLRQYYFETSQNLQTTTDIDRFSLNAKQEQSMLMKQQQEAAFINNITVEIVDHIDEETYEQYELELHNDKKTECSKRPGKQKSEPKEQKVHQCDTCGKTFNRREYLTQHIRIHTGEKPYRCHLCEKRFVNSGHLTTHMRTHTGERPHVCEQCPKAFSTRQELHKHTMVHNGERPFICKMCGKKFGSSSNLYSHLKHHTGEKNFTCEHCGKAFYTKQELKQHLVVHTGEKAFLCEYCNKRFSQIAHLRRHSKLHK